LGYTHASPQTEPKAPSMVRHQTASLSIPLLLSGALHLGQAAIARAWQGPWRAKRCRRGGEKDFPGGKFDRHERQVRQEYFFRSETEWSRERRPSLLRAFLDRPRIFLTPEFAFEAPARANLTRSLARLTADPAPPRQPFRKSVGR